MLVTSAVTMVIKDLNFLFFVVFIGNILGIAVK